MQISPCNFTRDEIKIGVILNRVRLSSSMWKSKNIFVQIHLFDTAYGGIYTILSERWLGQVGRGWQDTQAGTCWQTYVVYVSGKCSVSWSSHLLVGSVALLMLCFGLSFCAARHKPSNPHTDPLRIWQSRYSQSIHAYASPKTTTLSFVTVCWSWSCDPDDQQHREKPRRPSLYLRLGTPPHTSNHTHATRHASRVTCHAPPLAPPRPVFPTSHVTRLRAFTEKRVYRTRLSCDFLLASRVLARFSIETYQLCRQSWCRSASKKSVCMIGRSDCESVVINRQSDPLLLLPSVR